MVALLISETWCRIAFRSRLNQQSYQSVWKNLPAGSDRNMGEFTFVFLAGRGLWSCWKRIFRIYFHISCILWASWLFTLICLICIMFSNGDRAYCERRRMGILNRNCPVKSNVDVIDRYLNKSNIWRAVRWLSNYLFLLIPFMVLVLATRTNQSNNEIVEIHKC